MADGKTARPWAISLALAALAGAGLAAVAKTPAYTSEAESSRLAGPYLAAHSAQASGDWSTAADFAAAAHDADPSEPTLLRHTLLLSLARGDLAAASRLAAALPGDAPETPLLPLLNAVAALEVGDRAAAETALERLPDEGFQKAVRRVLLAELHAARGDAVSAETLLTGLLEKDGDPSLAAARLTSLALARGDFEAAAAFSERFAASEASAGLRLTVVQRLRRAGAFEAARRLADESLALYGEGSLFAEEAAAGRDHVRTVPVRRDETIGFGEALLDLARQADRRGSAAMTLVLARLAERSMQDDAEAAILIGTVFERFGRPEKALGDYRSVAASSEHALQAQLRASIATEAAGDRPAAIAALEAILRLHPQAIAPLAALGEMRRSAGDRHASLAAFEQTAARMRALGIKPSWQLQFALALSHYETGRWEQAAAPLAAVLEARPGEAQARALAALVMVQGGDLESAEAHAFAALDSGGHAPPALRAYAEVMLAQGKPQAAVEALEAAAASSPSHAEINEALGDAYWQVGRRTEAQFQWRRAADSARDAERLAKLERKLQVGLDTAASARDATTRLSTAEP